MISGIKHLVKCRCVLPQFKHAKDPPPHQFPVFSIINDDVVKLKYAQCPNCGIIHKVTEIHRSEIMHGRDMMSSIVTIADIKMSLPPPLTAILEAHSVDLATWENAQFIIENAQWGQWLLLTADSVDGMRQGKYVRILGETIFKIESYVRSELA